MIKMTFKFSGNLLNIQGWTTDYPSERKNSYNSSLISHIKINFRMDGGGKGKKEHFFKKSIYREFPGSPAVKTPCFQAEGTGSIPDQRTKIPQAARHSQKIKKIKKHL